MDHNSSQRKMGENQDGESAINPAYVANLNAHIAQLEKANADLHSRLDELRKLFVPSPPLTRVYPGKIGSPWDTHGSGSAVAPEQPGTMTYAAVADAGHVAGLTASDCLRDHMSGRISADNPLGRADVLAPDSLSDPAGGG